MFLHPEILQPQTCTLKIFKSSCFECCTLKIIEKQLRFCTFKKPTFLHPWNLHPKIWKTFYPVIFLNNKSESRYYNLSTDRVFRSQQKTRENLKSRHLHWRWCRATAIIDFLSSAICKIIGSADILHMPKCWSSLQLYFVASNGHIRQLTKLIVNQKVHT